MRLILKVTRYFVWFINQKKSSRDLQIRRRREQSIGAVPPPPSCFSSSSGAFKTAPKESHLAPTPGLPGKGDEHDRSVARQVFPQIWLSNFEALWAEREARERVDPVPFTGQRVEVVRILQGDALFCPLSRFICKGNPDFDLTQQPRDTPSLPPPPPSMTTPSSMSKTRNLTTMHGSISNFPRERSSQTERARSSASLPKKCGAPRQLPRKERERERGKRNNKQREKQRETKHTIKNTVLLHFAQTPFPPFSKERQYGKEAGRLVCRCMGFAFPDLLSHVSHCPTALFRTGVSVAQHMYPKLFLSVERK
ncbi:hypothetical protein CCUS01_16637 [Colletotrichum cuscutae]|uniref:Uncharacterized protein n=1 Tax=Colletotrichum cuscutae TaxID=1209917 RepID=A0AAI9Y5A4_9PEZI|nr:hypothetical protein CCUS01_16637 [Colletotrichum cuscutae]